MEKCQKFASNNGLLVKRNEVPTNFLRRIFGISVTATVGSPPRDCEVKGSFPAKAPLILEYREAVAICLSHRSYEKRLGTKRPHSLHFGTNLAPHGRWV